MRIVTQRAPTPELVRDRSCRGCLVKLEVFGLTDYDRVVYVDADALPLRSLDHLLGIPFAEPLAAPIAYWLPQPWWGSHLLVVKPSANLWRRLHRHVASAAARGVHDMDIVNVELGGEIHALPGETACLNTEWEDAGRPGAFGDPVATYARASVAHFSALSKPWSHTPANARRLRPNAHSLFHQLWETWWETREAIFRDGRPTAWGQETETARVPPRGRPVPRDSGAPLPVERTESGRVEGAPLAPGAPQAPTATRPESSPAVSLTVRRAYEFHLWFAETFQHRLGVRYRTFFETLMLALARNATTIVETGTARYPENWEFDGLSTMVFGAFAERYGATLWTCDVLPAHIAVASDLTAPLAARIKYVVSDSVEFLGRFRGPIDVLYLDAVDLDADAPHVARDHALREGQAALHALHERSIVLIDDCNTPGGGKGRRAGPVPAGPGVAGRSPGLPDTADPIAAGARRSVGRGRAAPRACSPVSGPPRPSAQPVIGPIRAAPLSTRTGRPRHA
jgi:predicted O-methyltransferase YrrM